jgi:hypothetical protein
MVMNLMSEVISKDDQLSFLNSCLPMTHRRAAQNPDQHRKKSRIQVLLLFLIPNKK